MPGPVETVPLHWTPLIPNSLSCARLLLAVVFPWVPARWRFAVVVAAGLSDWLDGLLSRLLRASSLVGQILDPIADKLFVGVALGTLLWDRPFGLGLLGLLLFRDLAVLAGSAWCVGRGGWRALRGLPPSGLGKTTTFGQFACLILLVYDVGAFPVVAVATGTASVAAGVAYLRRNVPGSRSPCAS